MSQDNSLLVFKLAAACAEIHGEFDVLFVGWELLPVDRLEERPALFMLLQLRQDFPGKQKNVVSLNDAEQNLSFAKSVYSTNLFIILFYKL